MVLSTPVIPIEWGLDKPGMQSKELADAITVCKAEKIWLMARDSAVEAAKAMEALKIHKQIANRLLEPFVEVTGLVSGVEAGWENFFALRAHEAADPHIQALAYRMLDLYNSSTPNFLETGEWHIPFGDSMPAGLTWEEQVKVAVARAARVSYNNFDGSSDIAKDIALHDRLAESGHWSAFEHIAQVPTLAIMSEYDAPKHIKYGNLTGWIQLRKTYPNECRKDSRVKQIEERLLPEN
jgi:thymidylate synthase ThyX